MKQAFKKQSGVTFIGLVFILGMIAMVVLFVLRLFPLYNEKFQIESAMETVVAQPDSSNATIVETRRAFMRAIAVTNISKFTDSSVKEHVNLIKPKNKSEPPLLHVQYQSTNKLFGDIELLMTFDKQIPLTNSTGGG
jgi:hypothetical protein